MKNFNNQRGIVTLEIILAATIISILAVLAMPRMAQLLDTVSLNYEMKHLYSTLNLARSIGRSSDYQVSIFTDKTFEKKGGEVFFRIFDKQKTNPKNRYEVYRPSQGPARYFEHHLSNGINVQIPGYPPLEISFDNLNEFHFKDRTYPSVTLTLTSRFGKNAYIEIDSVGRWRGTYEPPR